MAAEDQGAPAPGHPAPHLAQLPVEGLGLLTLQEPLAVGRVGDKLAVFTVPAEAAHICHLKADVRLHPRQGRVVPGDLDGVGVYIAAPDVIAAAELLVLGLVGGVQPAIGR